MNSGISTLFADAIDFIFLILPLFLAVVFVLFIVRLWVDYAREKFSQGQERMLLEIIPPQDIDKSPAAMELFFVSLHQTGGETTWIKKYINGSTRATFSLELVSIDGNVHFFIRTRSILRGLVESQLYAQYPGIEVREVEDYAQKFVFEPGKNDLWGTEFNLNEPDPYPIKTYVDYGLDTDPKEEFKIDPITPVLETLANLGKGEQMWFQIIIKAHKKEDKDPTKWFKKTDLWADTAKTEVKKIRDESIIDAGEDQKQIAQTEGQKRRITALERSVSKISFDVGFRAIYLGTSDAFNGINIPAMLGSVKQYASSDLNSFGLTNLTDFNFPWQDFGDFRLNKLKRTMLQLYKDRKFFFLKERKAMVLNVEELATIYHFPGRVSQTSSLGRTDSRKAAAPPNLPI